MEAPILLFIKFEELSKFKTIPNYITKYIEGAKEALLSNMDETLRVKALFFSGVDDQLFCSSVESVEVLYTKEDEMTLFIVRLMEILEIKSSFLREKTRRSIRTFICNLSKNFYGGDDSNLEIGEYDEEFPEIIHISDTGPEENEMELNNTVEMAKHDININTYDENNLAQWVVNTIRHTDVRLGYIYYSNGSQLKRYCEPCANPNKETILPRGYWKCNASLDDYNPFCKYCEKEFTTEIVVTELPNIPINEIF